MPTRDVELTDHQDEMIDTLVRSGRHRDASEVVSDALRLVERREAVVQAKLTALRDAVQVGIDAIDRGDYREFATAEELTASLTEMTDDILEVRDGDDA